jgi:DNA-binding NarL/FixJ family response regulator
VSGVKTVVIVDDDSDTRFLISRSLRSDDRIQVAAEAPDARSAVDAIRTLRPDVVVLDHYISGSVMGLDSAPVLKTISPHTKVIVFTETDLGLEAYLEPEIDAYLRKDELPRLLSVIQRVLGLDTQNFAPHQNGQ